MPPVTRFWSIPPDIDAVQRGLGGAFGTFHPPQRVQRIGYRKWSKANKTNILFFGNFHKCPSKSLEWGMDYLIDNEDPLYLPTKDLYYLGLVLERKYRLLRITYTVFMIGIVVSAFIIQFYDSSHLN